MNEDRLIKELLKSNDNIEVPIEITLGIDKTLNSLEDRKVDKNPRKQWRKYIVAASIALVITIGFSLNSEVGKAAVEKIRLMFLNESNNINLDKTINSGYIGKLNTRVNQEITNNGLTVKINEFYTDGDNTYLNLTLPSMFNGMVANTASFDIYYDNKEVIQCGRDSGLYKINDNKSVNMVINDRINKIDINKISDIKVIFNGFQFEKGGATKSIYGEWEFDFKFNGIAALKEIKTTKINKNFNIQDYKVAVENIKITPFKIGLNYTTTDLECKSNLYFAYEDKENKFRHLEYSQRGGKGVAHINLDTKNINNNKIYIGYIDKNNNEPVFSKDCYFRIPIK
ncbi:MAG: DUF4179 domain-containing protein [Clostridium sp.]